jgi:ribonuclease VapC
MVIDTSAVMAIFLCEPEMSPFRRLIDEAESSVMSAVTAFEIGIVAESKLGEASAQGFDQFLIEMEIEVIPVDRKQSEIARIAYRKFGKGRHPAGLNFGDCFSYALARVLGEPLLAKGNDFKNCDIELL